MVLKPPAEHPRAHRARAMAALRPDCAARPQLQIVLAAGFVSRCTPCGNLRDHSRHNVSKCGRTFVLGPLLPLYYWRAYATCPKTVLMNRPPFEPFGIPARPSKVYCSVLRRI